jgi:hypothetical protein
MKEPFKSKTKLEEPFGLTLYYIVYRASESSRGKGTISFVNLES